MAQLIKGKQLGSQTVVLSGNTGNVVISGNLELGTYEAIMTNAPLTSTSLTNKAYVDAVAQGVQPHAPVKVVATAQTSMTGLTTIDGYTLLAGDRVLLAGQTNKIQNGLFNASVSAWARTPDADGDPDNEVRLGDFVFVASGTTNGDSGWVLGKTDSPDAPITPDVDTQEWYKMAAPGSYTTDDEGITLDGNIFKLVLDSTTLTKSASGLKINDTYTSSVSTAVSSQISTESSTRSSGDVVLSTSISSEASSRASGDVVLSTSVSTETSLRVSFDESLSTSLTTEISLRTSADVDLSYAISSEQSSRGSADTSLSTAIANVSGDTSLSTGLSIEASTRASADVVLSTSISTESSTRSSADIVLSTSVSTESSTRSSADISLSTAISNISNPEIISETFVSQSGGTGTQVWVNGAVFDYGTGVVDLDSVTVFMNGIEYPFAVDNTAGIIFHTNSVSPDAGTGITLFFNGSNAGFAIETDDQIRIVYMVVT